MSASPTVSSPRPARNLGIDLARGLAVVLMIQTHALDGWVSQASKLSGLYRFTRVFSNIPAPLFLLLAGLSLGLQTASAERSGKNLAEVRSGMARRALEVVGYGYLVSLVYAVLDWRFDLATLLRADILHCIGLSLLVCTYLLVGRSWLGLRVLVIVLGGLALGLTQRWLPQLPLPLAAVIGLVIDIPPITRFPLLPLCGFAAIGVLLGARLRLTEWNWQRSVAVALVAMAVVYPLQELTMVTVLSLGGRLSRAHPAVVWNFLEGTARAIAVLSVSLAASAKLSEKSFGWLLRLGRGSLLAYAFHIPLCYGRIAQSILGKLDMAQALPLLVALIALTWLVVTIRDGVEPRFQRPRSAKSVAAVALLMLVANPARAQSAAATPSPTMTAEAVVEQDLAHVAHELASSGHFALAHALIPEDVYRAQVHLPDDYSIRTEVERCHQLFQSGNFRESTEAYALLLVARPDLVRVLFNIAQGLRRAGEPRQALAFYRRYLQLDQQSPLRAEVEGYIRELSALLSARALIIPTQPPTPVHKRAWFWVALTTGVVVTTTAVVLGVTLGTKTAPPPPPPEEILGPFDVMFPTLPKIR